MNKKTLELYLYMGSTSEIIKWLESEGVTNEKEALQKIESAVRGNVSSYDNVFRSSGDDYKQVSLAGTSNAVQSIVKYFSK